MAIKVDGTNGKLIFLAGTANSTTVAAAFAPTPWTLTLPPNAGTAGQVLKTDGTGATSWGAGADLPVANDTATAADLFPLFSSVTSGTLPLVYTSSPDYTFNPSTGQLSAKNVESSAGIHLNADTITASYTLPAGVNGLSAGPINVPGGVVVTVPAGQAWKVV